MQNAQAKEFFRLSQENIGVVTRDWDAIFGNDFRQSRKEEILAVIFASLTIAYQEVIQVDPSGTASSIYAAEVISTLVGESEIANGSTQQKVNCIGNYRSHPGVKLTPEDTRRMTVAFMSLAAGKKGTIAENSGTCFIETVIAFLYYLFSCEALGNSPGDKADAYLRSLSLGFGLDDDFVKEVAKARSGLIGRPTNDYEHKKETPDAKDARSPAQGQSAKDIQSEKVHALLRNKQQRLLLRSANIKLMSSLTGLAWFASGVGLPVYYALSKSNLIFLGGILLLPLVTAGSSSLLNGLKGVGIALIASGALAGYNFFPHPSEWFILTSGGFLAVWFVTRIEPSIQKDIEDELRKVGRSMSQ